MTSAPVATSVAIARILVATDFSQFSDNALHYALPIAEAYDSDLYVLHAYQTPAPPPPTAEYVAPPVEYDRQHAEQELRMLEGSGLLARRRHSLLVETGGAADVVVEATKKYGIDLVVAGTHGRGGITTLLVGSAAEEILRRVDCPVLIIGPHVPKAPASFKFQRILYATDYLEGSLHAFPLALTFLHDENAQLILLHALTSGGVLPREAQRLIDEGRQRLLRILPKGMVFAKEPIAIAEFGSPAEVILRHAEREGADLIVMGVRTAPSAERATHAPWTVVHRVLRHAGCPVLTVRA